MGRNGDWGGGYGEFHRIGWGKKGGKGGGGGKGKREGGKREG